MIERHDEELSRIYRDADGPRPPQRVDDNILAASQRVAGAGARPAGARFARRWGTPVALAATVLVTFTLALMVFERESGLDAMAPKAPRPDRPAKVSPAAPVRADQPAKSPPAELRSAAPAPAMPSRQAVAPLDRAKPATVETALSSERRATGQPARVPAVPRGIEILRKSEEVKPSPDAERAFDVQQPIRPAQAPAAAPPAEASAIREAGQTLQRAGAVGSTASRVVVSEANERTPEKWLEDIRKLRTEGKATEAERELAEFKKRYPDYRLPEDLR